MYSWRRFPFFDKEQVNEQHEALQVVSKMKVTASSSGRGKILLAESEGSISILSRDYSIKWFRAFQTSILQLSQLTKVNMIVALGYDEDADSPTIKIFNADKEAHGEPLLIKSLSVSFKDHRSIAISCMAHTEELQHIALGLCDGTVILIERPADKFPRYHYLLEASGYPVTGLGFRASSGALVLFVCTTEQVLRVTVSNKNFPVHVLDEAIGSELQCSVMTDQQQFAIGRPEAVYFYQPEGRGACRPFEGHKKILAWFRNYLILVLQDPKNPKFNTCEIYNLKNQFIAFSATLPAVRQVVCEWGSVYVICDGGRIFRLEEKDTMTKLETLFKRNLYHVAISLAEEQNLDAASIHDIYRKFGDHLYDNKGEYDDAIQKYTQTIGFLEPSYVIRKFLDAQRIHNLTTYLQTLHEKGMANSDHTTLLLNCFAEDHQLLTSEGFLDVDQYRARLSDASKSPLLVASYDDVTGHLVYQRPTRFIYNEGRSQSMVEVSSEGLSLLVTPEHDMFVKRGWLAKNAVRWPTQNGFRKIAASSMVDPSASRVEKIMARAEAGLAPASSALMPAYVTELRLDSDSKHRSFLQLYGFWLAGGSLVAAANDAGAAVAFASRKEEHLCFIREHVKTLGLTLQTFPGTPSAQLLVTDARWVRWFWTNHGARCEPRRNDTPLLPWAFSLPLKSARLLLQGLRGADGCDGENRISTSSILFRDQLVRLCLHAGYAARFELATPNRWVVCYSDAEQSATWTVHTRRDVREVPYHGRTWCVSVPKGLVFARRARVVDGVATHATTPAIVGNCYTKLKDIQKLNEFIRSDQQGNHALTFDVETAIRVCRQANYHEHALYLAKHHRAHLWYLKILLEDLKDYDEALDYIATLDFYEAEKNLKQYGSQLVGALPDRTTKLLMSLCTQFDKDEGAEQPRALPEEFIHIFVECPQSLVSFLEYMIEQPGLQCSDIVYTTLLEAYLREEDENARLKKALQLLVNGQARFDDDQALVLCQMYNFKAGVLILYERMSLYQEIVQYYMEEGQHSEVVAACKRFGDSDPHLWVQALSYFASVVGEECESEIAQVLEQVERRNLLTPLQAIQILSLNRTATLAVIKDFIIRTLRDQNEKIKNDKAEIKLALEETAKMRADIEELSTSAKVFQQQRCDMCRGGLEIPACHYLCGHSFHQHCLMYSEEDQACPKCAPSNAALVELKRALEENVNDHSAFYKQLQGSEDGFQVVSEYFSHNLFAHQK